MESAITCCRFRILEINLPSRAKSRGVHYGEEVIVGTNSGDIGVLVDKARFILIQEKTHDKQINCI